MQNRETEIADLRSRGLERVKTARHSGHLAARMRLRHSCVSALPSHLLAAVLLCWRHRRARQCTRRRRERYHRQRQSEHPDFAQ